MKFNERLKQLRKERNLTQSTVAEALGVTLRQYQRWESGEQTTTTENMLAIAVFFNTTLNDLCGREDMREADFNAKFNEYMKKRAKELYLEGKTIEEIKFFLSCAECPSTVIIDTIEELRTLNQ